MKYKKLGLLAPLALTACIDGDIEVIDDSHSPDVGADATANSDINIYTLDTSRRVDAVVDDVIQCPQLTEDEAGRYSLPGIDRTEDNGEPVEDFDKGTILTEEDAQDVILEAEERYTLPNNLTLNVSRIDDRRSSVSIRISLYINGRSVGDSLINLNKEPGDSFRKQFYEDYGFRVQLLSFNESELNVSLTALTGHLETPEDLYEACREVGREHPNCLRYSPHDSVEGEITIDAGKFVLVGPDEEETLEYMTYLSQQFETCYDSLTEEMGHEMDRSYYTVRLADYGYGVYITTSSRIIWPYNEDDYLLDYLRLCSEECNDGVVAHESAHTIIGGAPISGILNEGLATYFERETSDMHSLVCYDDYYTLYRREERREFGNLGDYERIPYNEGGRDLYWTAACFWEEYRETFGEEIFASTLQLLLGDREDDSTIINLFERLEEQFNIDMSYFREKYNTRYETDEISGDGAERNTNYIGASGAFWYPEND